MSFALLRSGSLFVRRFMGLAGLVGLMALTPPAQAQVTVTTTAFGGTLGESFESFPNYQSSAPVPITALPNQTLLFNGAATLTGTNNVIYEPSTGAIFSLGSNGMAQTAEGTKALGLNAASSTTTLTFNAAVTQFGGYFNATRTSVLTDTVTFTFYDAANNLVDTKLLDVNPDNTTSGALNFYGFTSPAPFQSVAITGNYVAIDGLRATPAQSPSPIPEPAPFALIAATLPIALLIRRLC